MRSLTYSSSACSKWQEYSSIDLYSTLYWKISSALPSTDPSASTSLKLHQIYYGFKSYFEGSLMQLLIILMSIVGYSANWTLSLCSFLICSNLSLSTLLIISSKCCVTDAYRGRSSHGQRITPVLPRPATHRKAL